MSHERLNVASALLVSDVHLGTENPALTDHFCRWITGKTTGPIRPTVLIVLGDLFDAWVGDDVLHDSVHGVCGQTVADCLRAVSDRGVRVVLMHGNRDFLIGNAFAKACGATLIDDPALLSIDNGPSIAITHGDHLCTGDSAYQQFRSQVRNIAWQQTFLGRPLSERLTIAQSLREQSEQEKYGKSMQIMDITPQDAELLVDRLGADLLLHGHTHRPGCSSLPNGNLRWVLPDWEFGQAPGLARGGGIWVDQDGIRVVPL